MINNKTLSTAILEVSKELNIPDDVVEVVYREFWNWVKNTLESIPVNQEMSEEEFKQLQTSINIPSLGKFYAKYSRANFLNKKYKEYAEKKAKN